MNTKNRTFSSTESPLKSDDSVKQHTAKSQQDKRQCSLQSLMQINSEDPSFMAKFNRMNPHALDILLFLIEHMNGSDAVVCSQVCLMDYFGVSRSTVVKCIQDLKKHGLLCIAKTGSSNVYHLNDDLIWKPCGTNSKNCEFPANIVLSYLEQDKPKCQKVSEHQPDQ